MAKSIKIQQVFEVKNQSINGGSGKNKNASAKISIL